MVDAGRVEELDARHRADEHQAEQTGRALRCRAIGRAGHVDTTARAPQPTGRATDEGKAAMPPTRRTTKSTGTTLSPPAATDTPAPLTASSDQDRLAAAAKPSPDDAQPSTLTLRLPFLTVSMTRPPAGSDTPADGAAHAGDGGRTPTGSSGLERLVFYGGITALGVAGIVDWPVAAAIAAGTYIASRTRGTPRATAA
jgi:hypothetical protein